MKNRVLQLKDPQTVKISFKNFEIIHSEPHKNRTLTVQISYYSTTSYSVGEFRNFLIKNVHLHQEILTERIFDWWRTRVNPDELEVVIIGKYETDPPSTIITRKRLEDVVREVEEADE